MESTTSWLEKLIAQYPPRADDDEENCKICLEEDGLCQEAAESIVEDVAEECEATEEDVARWMVEGNVAIAGLSIRNLTDQYSQSLEDDDEW